MYTLSFLMEYALFELRAIETSSLEARWFIQDILGVSLADICFKRDMMVQKRDAEKFISAIEKRKSGIPYAYVVGKKEFYGYEFIVNEHTLIPRPETERMIDYILSKDCPVHYLDMCSGSGNIGIVVGKKFKIIPTLVDISREAMDVAKKNGEKHQVRCNYIVSDLFEKVEGTFDVISCNPPYIPECRKELLSKEVVDYEPERALFSGREGLHCIEKFLRHIHDYLTPDGYAIIEIDDEHKNKVMELCRNFQLKSKFEKDYNDVDRFLIVKRS
ncbi:MAG: peptide chain release factor N(5)-glutamine methyltransferase [Tissierellia bacterium]|nr:peptide chain release factor N(5)-glutamine methyltransferase [Tissierellia bacterium]